MPPSRVIPEGWHHDRRGLSEATPRPVTPIRILDPGAEVRMARRGCPHLSATPLELRTGGIASLTVPRSTPPERAVAPRRRELFWKRCPGRQPSLRRSATHHPSGSPRLRSGLHTPSDVRDVRQSPGQGLHRPDTSRSNWRRGTTQNTPNGSQDDRRGLSEATPPGTVTPIRILDPGAEGSHGSARGARIPSNNSASGNAANRLAPRLPASAVLVESFTID